MSDPSSRTFTPTSTIAFAGDLPFALQSQIQMALAEIDLLHRIPKCIQATLSQNAKRNEQGSYDPQLVRITISRYAKDPLGTFIHEYGHFLDNRALHPLRKEYASRYDPDFEPLMFVCSNSTAIREMTAHLKNFGPRLTRADRFYLKAATEYHEIFARVYAQWICSKSLNFMLQASLHSRIAAGVRVGGRLLRLQWEPDDFADIMHAMERLFHTKGLL